jgi:murein DD-endopeptidase MepM/ murein hydrolase activator NlpD
MRVYFFVVLTLSWGVFTGLTQETTDGYTIHVVQRGENLFRIALSYGLTTDEVAVANGIENPANIQVGQRLLIPVDTEGPGDNSTNSLHTVQPGETLQSIATLYGIDIDMLTAENAIGIEETLVVGRTLVIPIVDSVESTGEIEPESNPIGPTSPTLIHTVQSGETLFRIAQQYNLTVNQLVEANTLVDPTRIYSGQQLIVPGLAPPQLVDNIAAPFNSLSMTPQILTEGKTGYIEVGLDGNAAAELHAQFLNKALPIVPIQENLYRIFVGIPVFTEPGIYPLTLTIANSDVAPINANIQIIRGQYGSETINLLDGRDNLLNNNVETAELELIQNLAAQVTPDRFLNDKMGLPAAAAITSGFGTRRSYNGGAFDRFHSGTDFAGVPGTPILAPAPGRVVMADALNVRGNATLIDHGWGVYTGYWHQTEIYVRVGDIVQTGQVIGTIGSTGRVTGAHLHWELWVNGVPVDPMQWVQQPFFN